MRIRDKSERIRKNRKESERIGKNRKESERIGKADGARRCVDVRPKSVASADRLTASVYKAPREASRTKVLAPSASGNARAASDIFLLSGEAACRLADSRAKLGVAASVSLKASHAEGGPVGGSLPRPARLRSERRREQTTCVRRLCAAGGRLLFGDAGGRRREAYRRLYPVR